MHLRRAFLRIVNVKLFSDVQGVFELPKKLRTAIDRGAYDVAVDSYAEVAPLLKKYGHKVGCKRSCMWLLKHRFT